MSGYRLNLCRYDDKWAELRKTFAGIAIMDKFKAMRYFCHIAETSSFSASARQLKVPVSTLSRSLQALESELGAALLQRSTRHVSLTEIGNIYLQHCESILLAMDRADSQVGGYQSHPSGILRISALPLYAEVRLLPLLEEFQQRYPEIVIDLDLSNQVVDLNRDGIDITFRGGSIPEERVIAHYVDENNSLLCASPDYLKRFGTPETIEDLSRHKAILYRAPGRVLRWQQKQAGNWMPVDIGTALISNGGQVIRQAVVSGKGLCLLPPWCMEEELARGDLVLVPFEPTISGTTVQQMGVYLLYQHAQYVIPKIKVAVDFFRQSLQPTQVPINHY